MNEPVYRKKRLYSKLGIPCPGGPGTRIWSRDADLFGDHFELSESSEEDCLTVSLCHRSSSGSWLVAWEFSVRPDENGRSRVVCDTPAPEGRAKTLGMAADLVRSAIAQFGAPIKTLPKEERSAPRKRSSPGSA